MFDELSAINLRPAVFAEISTAELWIDPRLAEQMLAAHLDPEVDRSSYRAGFVRQSVSWLIERFELGARRAVADLGFGPGLYGVPQRGALRTDHHDHA